MNDRVLAFGHQLVEIHLQLREQLAQLPSGGRELTRHCVAFCAAVRSHHTGEDSGAFAALAREQPALRPVLEQLERDHQQIADVLRTVEALAAREAIDQAEMDGLAALLESHFAYEEKKIFAALNDLPASTGTTEDLFGASIDNPW